MLWIQICLEVNYKFTSKRSEPSSRNFLIGEQPNPSHLLQQEDKLSRHRGAELRRRYELLGGTSLFIIFWLANRLYHHPAVLLRNKSFKKLFYRQFFIFNILQNNRNIILLSICSVKVRLGSAY